MGIDLISLAKECPDMVISIKITDLLEACRTMLEESQIQVQDNKRTFNASEEEYITRTKAMEILDVSNPTMWRWMKNGYLVPVHIGTKVRYRMSDVMKIKEGAYHGE